MGLKVKGEGTIVYFPMSREGIEGLVVLVMNGALTA